MTPSPRPGPSTPRAIAILLGKDLRIELRTLQSIPAMVLFSTTIYVIFRFGLDRTRLEGSLAAGVLLVTILFAALLAVNRIFVAEREQGGFEAIRLAPVDGTALFFAKAGALVVYLVALEVVALPVFWLFFLGDGSGLLPLLPVLLLLDVALAVTGALISPIATNSTARDLIGPLILLPLLVPPMIAASAAGERLLAAGGPSYDKYATWLGTLGLYDSIFLLIGWAVFDFLLED
ncbi:MAG: heme exporter protein CcmB [Solirubrobacterales bacterium]|nr:heme exporter protein CcmB [Solirubrobacterales bacterium]